MPIDEVLLATYQEYARELLSEHNGIYFASAEKLGHNNLRGSIWRLLNQDCPPSPRLSEALQTWANVKPVIIQALPGTPIFGEVGLIELAQGIEILILSTGEIDDSLLVKCQACGRQAIKRSGTQRFCQEHSYSTQEGRRWHRQQRKEGDP